MRIYKRIVLLALFCLVTVGMAASAKADTTYTYTGPQFNDFFGLVCPAFCNIAGSFTVATPLAPNENMYFLPDATPYSFTSGTFTADQTNSSLGNIWVSTDATGAIDAWDVNLYALSNAFYIVSTGPNKYASIDSDQVARLEANPPSGFKVDGGAGAEDAVGTWSVSTTGVPEPSIMLLLGMGLVGLFGLTFRKSA
jgi:hypothetical protein